MTGPEWAVDVVLAHLQARVPGRLAAMRTRLGVDVAELPEVSSWHHPRDIDLVPVEQYPAIMVAVFDTPGLVPQGRSGTGQEYLARYRLRVYAYARGEGAEAAGRARHRYLLAAREALLAGHRAPLDGPDGRVNAPVDLSTYRESYSEIDTLRSGASVGAAYAELELEFAEVLEP